MTRLLLVRHGETAFNAEKRFQGHVDAPLHENGRRQAAALQKRLTDEPIEATIANDLRRATETAEIIMAGGGMEVTVDGRWRELNFGSWEGMTYPEIQPKFPQQLAAWEADSVCVTPPNGETLQQLAERVQVALADLRQAYPPEPVLLVAHGGVLQTLLCLRWGCRQRPIGNFS